jgi:hypothetical protein
VRSSVPLGHKLMAVVLAAAIACGLYAFLRYREAQLASAAALSFDSTEAQQLDSGIARVPDPAVVFGQSILSDSFVARLVPQADVATPSGALAIGEFRARVVLAQPAPGLLWVRYRDPDSGQAAATANAVAKALAAWAPSTTSAPPPAAIAPPAPTAAPKPVPPAAAAPHAPPGPSLAAALGKLQAQLSAANQRAGTESSLRTGHDRQRYLESQVRATQQELADLRGKFAHSGSASGEQARLVAIQRALALFWPSAAGLNTAGTSEAQLRYEREQLTRDIGVIEQQRQAAQLEEAAHSVPANPPSEQSAPPAPQPQAAALPQVAPAAAAPAPPVPGAPSNPLHLERMAELPAPVDWWPSALIGCFCGLLYWGLAFVRYRSSSEPDDLFDSPEESSGSVYHLFDTDAPVPAGSRAKPVDDDEPVETFSRKRRSFTFDPDPTSAPAPDRPRSPEPIEGPIGDSVPDRPPDTTVVPAHTDKAETAAAADAVAPVRTPKEQDEASREKTPGMADPWGEEIRKNLSRTTIARALDTRTMAEETAAAKGSGPDEAPPPSHRDRHGG